MYDNIIDIPAQEDYIFSATYKDFIRDRINYYVEMEFMYGKAFSKDFIEAVLMNLEYADNMLSKAEEFVDKVYY
ncbi:MAG: hypothetical protein AB8U25_05935 [Rickettsiales endosymbiont of Dermacentor nuttalli]